MRWTKPEILVALRRLHKAGKDISYNHLAKRMQAIVSAAAYHFGSYRRAVEAAGVDYADVLQRPKWTRARIATVIKRASRKGEDLHWSAVSRRRDELGRAAFAALQDRLFGTWDAALRASGLDPADVSRYRRWTRESISAELKRRLKKKNPLNSGSLQKTDPGLHAAAIRHFGSYDAALRSAGVNPKDIRRRKKAK